MSRLRLLLVICASTLAVAALAIVLMNNGDEEDEIDSGAALSEYFAAMSAINDKSDTQFEDTVFGVEQESARSYAEAFDSVLAMLESEYEKVSPPSAVEDEHASLILAIQNYRTGVDHGLRPLDIDAPAADFETLFSDVLADEDQRVSSAFCKIQEIATAEGISAEVGCPQT
jgi:hypothetical protein